jgi:hypothetical protein
LVEIAIQYLNVAANLTTVVGVAFFIIHLRVQSKMRFNEMRPYVHLSLDIVQDLGRKVVELTIINAGRTPATNIVLAFEAHQKWHAVKNPDYPFLTCNGGLTDLLPNQKVVYFMGPYEGETSLSHLKNQHIETRLSYQTPGHKKRMKATQKLSLSNLGYLRRTSI